MLRRLTILLLIVGCKEETALEQALAEVEQEIEDCAGVAGGDAVSDIDRNCYSTIQIGEQLWMAENLRVTHFNNGDEITYPSDEDWGSNDEGQYGIYDNDSTNADIYGNLYNWAVVNDIRGICPEEFYVPTDEKFMQLEIALGMIEQDAERTNWRGSDEGDMLKIIGTSHWDYSLNSEATNESGFTALPGGFRVDNLGFYSGISSFGYYWTASEDSESTNNAWRRNLSYDRSDIYRTSCHKKMGYSVRCLKD